VETFRNSIIVFLMFCVLSAESCKEQKTVHVELHLTETSSYCGGAAPSREMEEAHRTPKPIRRNLYLYTMDSLLIDTLVPTGNTLLLKGEFPTGNYHIRAVSSLESRVFKTDIEKCAHEWSKRVLADFRLTSDSVVNLNIHFPCNPCYPPAP
jgi:hypothetical protein